MHDLRSLGPQDARQLPDRRQGCADLAPSAIGAERDDLGGDGPAEQAAGKLLQIAVDARRDRQHIVGIVQLLGEVLGEAHHRVGVAVFGEEHRDRVVMQRDQDRAAALEEAVERAPVERLVPR